VSPILVRPVREQFEHDRIIRILQAKYKRKYEVAINPGAEQNASVEVGDLTMYPDLALFSLERGRKLQATVEVETSESVNSLEAMAEWGPFSRLRTAFFLYVPVNAIDSVRRLCSEHHIEPAEIWTYHSALDQVRFTMVHRAPESARPAEARPARAAAARTPQPTDGRSAEPVTPPAAPKAAARRPAAPAKRETKAAPRSAKAAKKSAKKAPRVTASRPRPSAKKKATKTAAKRSASPKR
jgi:hypothetical protein